MAANSALGIVGSWNALFLSLVVLDDQELWTLPLGTMQFSGQCFTEWARIMALVIVMIPAVVFYLLTERYIVAGLTTVKG